MTDIEKGAYKFLLVMDAIAIIISMVAGPLSHNSLSIGAASAAVIISIALIIYGLYFWQNKV